VKGVCYLPAQPHATPSPPFIAYRVALARDVDHRQLEHLGSVHPVFGALLGGRRAVTLAPKNADAAYEATLQAIRGTVVSFPLRFTPVRCARGRALPFESIVLNASEILYLVHDGFFGAERGRQAAITAVQACGALPVPALSLAPLRRDTVAAVAERHVDTLIEREPELRSRGQLA
jgi:hypothetical protein